MSVTQGRYSAQAALNYALRKPATKAVRSESAYL
jgi:hypothetical protein